MNKACHPAIWELQKTMKDFYKERLARLCLFGSYARGTADGGSDIDVMVVLKGKTDSHAERIKTLDIRTDLSLAHHVVISCLFVDTERFMNEESPLMRNVRNDGIYL